MNTVYLSLGSNLGNRQLYLEKSRNEIAKIIGSICAISPVYETEPWGFDSDLAFLNQILKVETKLSPENILSSIRLIETELGRVRGEERYSSRTIDIDILFYDDLIIDNEMLTIPHPRMTERRFILKPLCDIAATLIHPTKQKTIQVLLNICLDSSAVKEV